ncbi:ABC transporter permease [Methylocystis parvus]|uniref:ABC-2 type transporter domain-containing protein n=1 Tax=Methylocystis parvus TaxID=134 RepID=A0A6B8M7Q3_9HYPH|nr:hypothetical protein [Methylocystis parvus]QGM98831.1 hypothetical protein F7D14_15975 [Methylocystis parvus]WBK00818.1 hypothetical protein MMG94_03575 [Methylocystis parvus OBBP]
MTDHSLSHSFDAFSKVIATNQRIIAALILQDMRTRFGSSYLSYIIAILWPLTHFAVIVLGYAMLHFVAPVADDPIIFAATGALPYMLCLYPARLMSIAILQNRQVLAIPCVRPLHLLTARAVIEILSALLVSFLVFFVFYLLDYEIIPSNIVDAISALFATMYFGIGYGVFGIIIIAIFGYFANIVIIFSVIILYFASGIYIHPGTMTERALELEYYNPLFNCAVWMRSSYYVGFEDIAINKGIIFWAGTSFLCLGLIGERYLRGKFFTA